MEHPCEECLRWPECAGVAWGTPDCHEWKDWEKKGKPLPIYQDDDRTESGLLEED